MRRAAISSASNIVEGSGKESLVEFIRYLEISFGSLRELNYLFSVAKRLGYINEADGFTCESKLNENEKVLAALIRKLRQTNALIPNN